MRAAHHAAVISRALTTALRMVYVRTVCAHVMAALWASTAVRSRAALPTAITQRAMDTATRGQGHAAANTATPARTARLKRARRPIAVAMASARLVSASAALVGRVRPVTLWMVVREDAAAHRV